MMPFDAPTKTVERGTTSVGAQQSLLESNSPSTPAQAISDIKELKKIIENHDSEKELWMDISHGGVALGIGKDLFRFEGDFEALGNLVTEIVASKNSSWVLSGYDTKSLAHQMKIKPNEFSSVGHDLLMEAYCLGLGGDLSVEELGTRFLNRKLPELAMAQERLVFIKDLSKEISIKLEATPGQKVLDKIDKPLIPVLYKMECAGILIDTEALQKSSAELLKEAQVLEKEICGLANYEFNVGSPKQLAQVLFDKLKLPVIRKTKTGFSTDSDVLEKLKSQHPIAEKILEWRELTKLRSTYVEALPRLQDPKTHRVHTTYNQAVTSTGRLSSNNPNLQNIPIRTPRGQRIRESFIAPKGFALVSADYSQVELRILAHITKDAGLCKAFEEDIDIHTATASEVFGVPLDKVSGDHRRAAKAINFGIVYGMSDFGLAENLGIERKEASDYIGKYFQRYPGVRQYMDDIVELGKKQGYVETLFGRRRYYPELKSSNGRFRQMAERAAINMPIQGAAADIMKIAMIQIDKHLSEHPSNARMLLQVHDELVFEVKENLVKDFSKEVKGWMENAVKLRVPLKTTVGFGPHWGSAH